MELEPTDLILRRRTALGFTRDRHINYVRKSATADLRCAVSRMAAGSVSLVAVLRDARTAVKLAQTA
jgi:hypothetical protein